MNLIAFTLGVIGLGLFVGGYFFYHLVADVVSLLSCLVTAFDTLNQFNNDWMDFNATIEERRVAWRNEELDYRNQANVLRLEEHQAFLDNQHTHRDGVAGIVESIKADTLILETIASTIRAQSQSPKRSHHRKVTEPTSLTPVEDVMDKETIA